jgi:hypothetical protein
MLFLVVSFTFEALVALENFFYLPKTRECGLAERNGDTEDRTFSSIKMRYSSWIL